MSDFASWGFAFFASGEFGNALERRSRASRDFSVSPSAVYIGFCYIHEFSARGLVELKRGAIKLRNIDALRKIG